MAGGPAKAQGKYRPRAEKLLDQVREVLRYHHYSLRTEKTYCDRIVRFIRFHDTTHPRELGKAEIEACLSHLAMVEHVAAATQNQAYNAILFLYRHVLDLPELTRSHRDTKPRSATVFVTPWLCVSIRGFV